MVLGSISMNTEIFIVSYLRDKPWLEFNLRSIEKFCKGFAGVTVLVPELEFQAFSDANLHRLTALTLKTYDRPEPESHWHLRHQVEKCYADVWCPAADFILHTDSDCIFTEPVTPEDYFENGKPVMLHEAYSMLPATIPWKAVTELALGFPVQQETMRRHPQVNPAGVYEAVRSHIAGVHKMDFRDYVMRCKADFPWGFSEHNAIGAFALHDATWRERYHWIDLATQKAPKDKLIQFWSHSPPDKEQEISHFWHDLTWKRVVPGVLIEKILAS